MILIAFAGCTATLDSIPTGRWEGEGQWAGWKENDQGVMEHVSGRYRTSVAVAKTCHAGADLLVITGVSDHRAEPEFGASGIRVAMTLGMPARYADGSIGFNTHADVATCQGSASPDPDAVDYASLLEHNRVPPARLSRHGFHQLLEVSYKPAVKASAQSGFTETYTFIGNQLIKKGRFGEGEQSDKVVRWTEKLKRCSPLPSVPEAILLQGPPTTMHPRPLVAFAQMQALPKRDYGVLDAGELVEVNSERVFRLRYTREACERVMPHYAPHSGYSFACLRQPVDVADALVFRYRTDDISDLRLILEMDNQTLSWFLTLAASAEWRAIRLPLSERLTSLASDEFTKSIRVTTFATVPANKESVFLDIDGLGLDTLPMDDKDRSDLTERLTAYSRLSAELDRHLRIQNLTSSEDCYNVEAVQLSWDFVNTSSETLIIPSCRQYSHPMPIIGLCQTWIEPLDERARQMNFGRSAREGSRYACGGSIIPLKTSSLEPGQAIHQTAEIRLHPGLYRYYVELKSAFTSRNLGEASVEFEVLDDRDNEHRR
jgi:hypothetical protein